jgi:hypothetical protein
MTVLVWATVVLALSAMALVVPQKVDRALQDAALLAIQPARDLADACRRYWQAFPTLARSVLGLGGITEHHLAKSVGALVATATGVVSLLCEFELAVLALAALGIGSPDGSVLAAVALSAPDAMAFTIVGTAALSGILVLDVLGVTTWLPLPMPPGAALRGVILVLGLAVVIGCCACGAALALFRHDAVAAGALDPGLPGVQQGIADTASHLRMMFAFIGAITTLTSIVTIATLPAALAAIIVVLLLIGLVLAGVTAALARIVDRLVTVAFGFVASVLAVLSGLLGALSGHGQGSSSQPPTTSESGATHPALVVPQSEPTTVPDSAPAPPATGPVQPAPVTSYDAVAFDPLG